MARLPSLEDDLLQTHSHTCTARGHIPERHLEEGGMRRNNERKCDDGAVKRKRKTKTLITVIRVRISSVMMEPCSEVLSQISASSVSIGVTEKVQVPWGQHGGSSHSRSDGSTKKNLSLFLWF